MVSPGDEDSLPESNDRALKVVLDPNIPWRYLRRLRRKLTGSDRWMK